MKYYLIAGEASGDLHGANLIRGLKKADAHPEVRAWGGDLMEAQGAVVVKHYRELAFMGFVEVVQNLRTILRNLKQCKSDILQFQPDALVLIDYPGFNLRIAKWAKKQGLKVIYYISPQIWAWHSSRVHGIKASVDLMFVILPFEQEFYARYDYPVVFTGHPLLDLIPGDAPAVDIRAIHPLDERPLIALLPGSRRQEISKMLPLFLQIAPTFPQYQFVIAAAPAIPEAFYRRIMATHQYTLPLLYGQTYPLLAHAHAALVSSGTATLETALFRVPQVVCYTANRLSYLIARRLANVAYISLPNLILNRPLLRELIQDDFNLAELERSLHHILMGDNRNQILQGYDELAAKLGTPGAAERAAGHLFSYLAKG